MHNCEKSGLAAFGGNLNKEEWCLQSQGIFQICQAVFASLGVDGYIGCRTWRRQTSSHSAKPGPSSAAGPGARLWACGQDGGLSSPAKEMLGDPKHEPGKEL